MDIKNSMLLANMMNGKGGGTKTLNLVAVNGATYDDDYIFTKTSSDGMDMYFETPDTIFSSINADNYDSVEIKLKMKLTSNYNSPISSDKLYGFSMYCNSSYKIGVVLQSNIPDTYTISTGQWYWFKITKDTSHQYSFSISTDDETYNYITYNYNGSNIEDNNKLIIGKGTSTGTAYNFQGSIDFKECSIKINGEEVLWV